MTDQYFGIKFKKGEITLEKDLSMNEEIVVAIGIKRNLSGLALFGLTREEAVRLSSYVLEKQGLPGHNDWDELAQSVLREFGNVVVGYVTQLYEKEGLVTDITTPSIIPAQQLSNYREESAKFVMKSDLASIVVKLHIKKN
jgi:CheY-specific phosphatase CheX